MCVKIITVSSLLAALSILLLGCAGSTAPSRWLPEADEAQRTAFGAWAKVKYNPGDNKYMEVRGELIAFHSDTIFVLSSNALEGIPRWQIKSIDLTTFNPKHGVLGFWTLIGSLSTASHGYYMVLSLPVWLLTGISSAAGQSRTAHEKYPGQNWHELNKFARFPAGLPPQLDRSTLSMKPVRYRRR